MLSLKFAGNVINMQFSPIKLPSVHDPQNITRLHTYSHMKILGGAYRLPKCSHWSVIEHRTRKQDIEVGNYTTQNLENMAELHGES